MTRDRAIDVNGKPAVAAKENAAVLNYFRQPSKVDPHRRCRRQHFQEHRDGL